MLKKVLFFSLLTFASLNAMESYPLGNKVPEDHPMARFRGVNKVRSEEAELGYPAPDYAAYVKLKYYTHTEVACFVAGICPSFFYDNESLLKIKDPETVNTVRRISNVGSKDKGVDHFGNPAKFIYNRYAFLELCLNCKVTVCSDFIFQLTLNNKEQFLIRDSAEKLFDRGKSIAIENIHVERIEKILNIDWLKRDKDASFYYEKDRELLNSLLTVKVDHTGYPSNPLLSLPRCPTMGQIQTQVTEMFSYLDLVYLHRKTSRSTEDLAALEAFETFRKPFIRKK